jgi:prepilin-type N-terminal cleavage/methylation domain-containing protein
MSPMTEGRAERAGMTLIEVMVALVILSGSLIAMGNFMGKFAHTQRRASMHSDAIDLATDVMDSVQHDSTYAAIPTDWSRTSTISRDNASFVRTTTVKQIGGAVTSTVNYYIVTTQVVNTQLIPADTVKQSIIIRPF